MTRKMSLFALLVAVSVLYTGSARAEGDAERGKVLADTCRGCHFIPEYKNSYPVYKVPMLGGQNAVYISQALAGYKQGSRAHVTMNAQAADKSEQDIADIVAYLASLGGPRDGGADGPVHEKAAVCSSCHGERGISLSPEFPNLAGQHASYLERSLEQYRSGSRQNAIMAGFAATLSDADIKILAEYFARQKGLFTPGT